MFEKLRKNSNHSQKYSENFGTTSDIFGRLGSPSEIKVDFRSSSEMFARL